MESPLLLEKRFAILEEISSVISATKDITTLANLMLDRAIEYTNAEKGSLMMINEMNELYILASRGFDISFVENYRIKVGEGIAGIIAENRSCVLVEDIEEDERFKRATRDRYRTKSFISCPIIGKDKLFGIININDKKDGSKFLQAELTLLNVIATQAGIIFENIFLINQLSLKAAELEDINKRLMDADMEKTEFVTRISHEFRSPLNSIKGAIHFLQQSEKLKMNQLKEFFHIIDSEASNLVLIVENLVNFLRVENEGNILKKAFVNLTTLLEEVSKSDILRRLIERKNLILKINIGNDIHDIACDKIKICQLFLNLLEGALSFLQNGDSILIHVHKDDLIKVTITVSSKLPDNILPCLHTSKDFYLGKWSSEEVKLYISKKIAEAHGWIFEAKNIENTFQIILTIPKIEKEKIDTAITLSSNLFVECISELLQINICSLMLKDELSDNLIIRAARGLTEEIMKTTRISIGEQIAGWVALEGKPLLIDNIEDDSRFARVSIPQYNTKSLISLPLKIHDQVIGVLNLNNKKDKEPFGKRDLFIASFMAERISSLINKIYSGELQQKEIDQIIISLEKLSFMVQKYHKKNSIFPDLVLKIMEKLALPDEEIIKAVCAAIIYDLGIVSIDEEILMKKNLTPSDINSLKIHPYTTVGLLSIFEFPEDIKVAILHHHERYDGRGYPDGLKGTKIPLISRVIAVVDSFCAMTTEKPYGNFLTSDGALKQIQLGSGSQYDPEIVKAFEEVLKVKIEDQ